MEDYSLVTLELHQLSNRIKRLQTLTTEVAEIDLDAVKRNRNKCFDILITIYEKLIRKWDLTNVEGAYIFLTELQDLILLALKRSHTGNDRMIFSSNCFCINRRCALLQCSEKCDQACVIHDNVVKYTCLNGSGLTVSLNSICNGMNECPQSDDETHCNKGKPPQIQRNGIAAGPPFYSSRRTIT